MKRIEKVTIIESELIASKYNEIVNVNKHPIRKMSSLKTYLVDFN